MQKTDALTCSILLGLNVFVKVWFDKAEPLLYASFQISTALTYITEH